MMRVMMVVALVCCAYADLSYVESSNGFQTPTLDGGQTELEFADINNDGNIDILSIGDHGNPYINTQEHGVMVWFGDGHGNWSVYQYGDFGYGGIAIGDVNGDGLLDIGYGMHHNYASGDLGDQLMEVALGDGTGRMWTAWDDSMAQEGQDWGMFSTDFADIDNDGRLDVGACSFGADDGIAVYLNLGNGTWRHSFGFLGGNCAMEFYFRDVNRDGNADIIVSHQYGAVYFGDGQGGFVLADSGLARPTRGFYGISAGDVDNDGGADIVFANSNGGVEVWVWNDDVRRWQSFSGTLPTTGGYEAARLCDMNCDGFLDVVAQGNAHLTVWTGDGAGNWFQAADVVTPTPGYYAALTTGWDFDHNGRPDIVMVTDEGSWPNDRNWAHAFREATPAETLRIRPVFPRGREKFRNGCVQFIDWWSEAPVPESTRVKLELSATGTNGPWTLIADSLRNNGRYQWTVPHGIISPDCYVRYTVSGPQSSHQALTARAFTIGDTQVGMVESGHAVAQAYDRLPTLVRGTLRLPRKSGTVPIFALLDISGRKVLDLHSGANDVRRLAPGVFFVSGQGADSGQQPAVQKVTITE
jgi:hypothetical protein